MKMKKFVIIALSILGVFVVVSIILALLAIATPLEYSYTVAEAEADSLLAAEIADMISDAIADDEGSIPEIAEISIPPDHANALIRLVECRINMAMKDKEVTCTLTRDGDAFRAAASYPLPFSTALVLHGTVTPSIETGVLHLPVNGLKLGRLPISTSCLPFGEVTAEKDVECEAAALALASIHHLSFASDGSIKLGIRPAKVSGFTRFLIEGRDGD